MTWDWHAAERSASLTLCHTWGLVVGEEHGQEPHEVCAWRSLLAPPESAAGSGHRQGRLTVQTVEEPEKDGCPD